MKIYLKEKKTLLKCCVMLRFTWKPGTGGELQSDQRARLFLCGQWLGSQPAEEGQEGRQEVQPDVHLRPGEGEKGVSRQTSVLQLGKTRRESFCLIPTWHSEPSRRPCRRPEGQQAGPGQLQHGGHPELHPQHQHQHHHLTSTVRQTKEMLNVGIVVLLGDS